MKKVKIRHKVNNEIIQIETNYGEKIEKNMIIADVLKAYPSTIKVINKFQIHCARCIGAQFETLEEGAKIHNINPSTLIQALNKEIQ